MGRAAVRNTVGACCTFLLLVTLLCIGLQAVSGATTFSGDENIIGMDVTNSAHAIAVDLNGDSYLDVVATGSLDKRVVWYKNIDGKGTFSSGTELDFPGRGWSVAAADFNGDGYVDLTVGGSFTNEDGDYYDAHITIFESLDGAGTFDAGVNITTPTSFYPSGIEVADLDGDGDIDMVVPSNSFLYLFVNDGTGVFDEAVVLASGSFIWEASINDMDGDTVLDIVYSDSSAGGVVWIGGDGVGGFGNPTAVLSTDRVYGISTADMDGDGDLDVVLSMNPISDYYMAWSENINGDGSVWVATNISTSTEYYYYNSVVADLDNDNDMDILVHRPNKDATQWFENLDSEGTFSSGVSVLELVQDFPWGLSAADLDGDGDLDMLSSSYYDGEVLWVENLFDPTLLQDDDVSTTEDDVVARVLGDDDQVETNGSSDIIMIVAIGGSVVLFLIAIAMYCIWLKPKGQNPHPSKLDRGGASSFQEGAAISEAHEDSGEVKIGTPPSYKYASGGKGGTSGGGSVDVRPMRFNAPPDYKESVARSGGGKSSSASHSDHNTQSHVSESHSDVPPTSSRVPTNITPAFSETHWTEVAANKGSAGRSRVRAAVAGVTAGVGAAAAVGAMSGGWRAVGTVAEHVPWIRDVYSLLDAVVQHVQAHKDMKGNMEKISTWAKNLQQVMMQLEHHFEVNPSPMSEALRSLGYEVLVKIKILHDLLVEYGNKSVLAQFAMSRTCKHHFDEADDAVQRALATLDVGVNVELLGKVGEVKEVILEIDGKADMIIAGQIRQEAAAKEQMEMFEIRLSQFSHMLEGALSGSGSSENNTARAKEQRKKRLEMLQIEKKDLTFTSSKPFAVGGYSSVYQVVHKGEVCAAKVTSIKNLGITSKSQVNKIFERFVKELDIMSKMHSPYVVKVLGAFTSSEEVGLVMEFVERGSLHSVLEDPNEREKLTGTIKHSILMDIATAECYLYQHNVQHRDLKSLNVLITHDWQAKIADFGMSKTREAISSSATISSFRGGTLYWKAPELLRSGGVELGVFTEKSDVYSFGVIVWEVMCGEGNRPWQDYPTDEVMRRVMAGAQLSIPAGCPFGATKLMLECWKEQEARPPFSKVSLMLQENTWA